MTVARSRAAARTFPAIVARVGESGGVVDAAIAFALAALMAAAFGSYVVHGGLTSDDWYAGWFESQHGYGGAVDHYLGTLDNRPVLAILTPLPRALFGGHVHAQLIFALVLGLATAIAFYVVLRQLTLRPHEAGAMAALLVLFPWSDSARLWVTGSLNQVALILYLAGLILALHALARGRRGLALHCLAAVLYAAAVLTYEAVGAVALLTGALYLLRAPRRRALARWGIDVLAVAGAIAYSRATTGKVVKPLSAQLDNAVDMARGAVTLLTHAVAPADVPHEAVGLAVLAVLGYAVAVALRNRRDRELRRWLAITAIAGVAVLAGYVMFVPDAYWTPQKPNLENRVNLVAALGMVVLVYGLLRVAALLFVRRASTAAASIAAIAVAAGYLVLVHDDQSRWERASAEQRAVLATIHRTVPRPRPSDRIFTFGARAEVAPSLPVFFDSWDLWAAVNLQYSTSSLSAYPVFAGAQLACAPDGVSVGVLTSPTPNGTVSPVVMGESPLTPYGSTWFVDPVREAGRRIDSRVGCVRALRRFPPGPFQ